MSSTPGPADRRERRRAARAAGRAGGERRSPASRWLLPGVILAAVVIAGVLALVLPGANAPTTGGSSSVPPSAPIASTSSGPTGSGAVVEQPTITGAPLPPFEGPDGDAAVGQPAPEVSGTDFAGRPVSIEADGRPKVVVFLAHWCPHCQAEVPLIQTWVSGSGVPEGIDVVSVATGSEPSRPNYPPDAWLQREGWTVPVVVDPTDSVAAAYGLTAYPFWVFIDGDGSVVGRAVGEITIPDLEAAIGRLTGG